MDHKRFNNARAAHIINKLAQRGNGDWTLHYKLGEVGLPLLIEVQDCPSTKVIERAIGELAIPSANGRG